MDKQQDRKRVLVIDDDFIVEDGYRRRIEATGEFEVVKIAQYAEQALSLVKEFMPDLVIIDLKFGEDHHAGARAIRELRHEFPEIKILAASVHSDLVEEAHAAGANATLVRGSSLQTLLDKMNFALLSPVYQHFQSVEKPKIELRKREYEALTYLCHGLANKEIAVKMSVAPNTVKGYVKNIFAKLEVTKRSEVAGKALKLGWLTSKDLHPNE